MPTRIDVLERVIPRIPIPIKPTGTTRLRHNGIGANEATQRGRVVAGVVIHQAKGGLITLGGEAKIGYAAAVGPSLLAVGQVAGFAHHVAVAVGC